MLLARFFQAVFILSLLGIILVLFQAGAASAGQVVFSQDYRTPGSSQVITFSKPETLHVFQSNLQANRPDYYTFQADKETILKVKLDTLRLVGQDNFQPSLALFGPGLPQPGAEEVKLFPYSLPAGNGLLVSAESGQATETGQSLTLPSRFDEPWTQAGYWERQSLLNQLPESGTYFLVVYSLDQQTGKYALFVGDKPEAGWRETLTFPVTWARLHYWFDDLWWPTLALVVVGLIGLALIYAYGRLVGRQFRQVSLASRNGRRAALLKKKIHHTWQQRRINRKPALKPLSSNVIIARLLTQTAYRSKYKAVAAGPNRKPTSQNGELLAGAAASTDQSPSFNWELLGQSTPLPADKLTVANGKNDLPGQAAENDCSKIIHNEDGLTQWGQRFKP